MIVKRQRGFHREPEAGREMTKGGSAQLLRKMKVTR